MPEETKENIDNIETQSPDGVYLSESEYRVLSEKEARRAVIRRRIVYAVFVLTVSVILAAVIFPHMIRTVNEGLIVQSSVSDPDIGEKADGVYMGEHSTFGFSCTVEVTVISHTVTHIDIVRSSGIDRERAEAVASAITAYNTFELDSLSFNGIPFGREPTDIVVYIAVKNALTEGISV